MAVQRNTIQKSLINEALQELSHPTAEDIYEYVHRRYPSIGKATLYRNLKIMSEEGAIKKLGSSRERAGRYDASTRPHFHGECRKCGVLCDIEIDETQENKLKSTVVATGSFVIEDCEVIFKGLCPECAKKEKNGGENERS